jgi:hypothetical protein
MSQSTTLSGCYCEATHLLMAVADLQSHLDCISLHHRNADGQLKNRNAYRQSKVERVRRRGRQGYKE